MASNAAVEGLSGAAGGIIALVATYPLMTVRLAADCVSYGQLSSSD